MQVIFLGTSAAPSMPIPFCTCPICSDARKAGGKNLRRRSSIMINDDLLIDIGPDIATASLDFNLSLTNIKTCLITHVHEDLFDPEFIISRHAEYGTVIPHDLLLVSSYQVLKAIDTLIGRRCTYGSIFNPETQAALKIKLLPVTPFKTYEIENYRVTGYPANHGHNQGYLLYAIEQQNRAIFYGTDTSIVSEQVWERLLQHHTQYDLIVLDHTYGIGFDSRPGDHLSSKDVIAHTNQFRKLGLLKNNATVYATHISHEGNLAHNELDHYAKQNGYRIAYDGLKLVLNR